MNNNKKTAKKYYKRRDSKPAKDDTSKMGEEDTRHKYNDVSWYTKNDQMLKDAASLSYNFPVGLSYASLINAPSGTTMTRFISAGQSPSLCSLRVVPTIGMSSAANSPANLAANNVYAYVRYMNSGSKNYDQADLMLYLMAMDSIYSRWNWLKRIYGYMRVYSQYNRTMPRAFAMADHINFDDWQNHLVDLRYYLNQTAAQISSFCVPAVMPIFIRHSWMFSNIYKDSDSQKAQLYMFNPAGFYFYDETTSKYGGKLSWTNQFKDTSNNDVLLNFNTVINDFNSMIAKVSYSEDIGVMSGDILKAYGQEKLFKLSPVTEDYMIEPVYNEEVLNQIHNSTVVPIADNGANGNTNLSVTQDPDTGFLIWGPSKTSFNINFTPKNIMLNMPWDDVTPANTMVGTRLTSTYKLNSDGTVTITACGTEIVDERKYIYATSSGLDMGNMLANVLEIPIGGTGSEQVPNKASLMATISQFDWHPLVPLVAQADTTKWIDCGVLVTTRATTPAFT